MTLNHSQWVALLPILLTGGTAVFVMLAISVKRNHWWNATFCVAGLNIALLSLIWVLNVTPQVVTPLLVVDGYAVFYSALILMTSLGTATLTHAYMEGYASEKEEIYLLLALAALGGIVMACSNHFASFFIGLELLSIPLFGMIAYPVRDKLALEGGVKYLVLSAAASAFLLFGMALLYAETGTLGFPALYRKLAGMSGFTVYAHLGMALVLVGVGFKLSLVPFHLWTPDVYQASPAPVTAFLSTASKTAVFAVLLRFFVEGAGYTREAVLDILTVLAIASILVGNVLALQQNNLKRMLAYSSIAHFGYLLVALVAKGPLAVEAVGVYLLTYVVTNLGAFGVVTLMSSPRTDAGDAEDIDEYRGLFWRRPFLTSIMTAMLLSLAGIPVTAGFIGKFYVLAAGVDARLWLLVGALVLGSAIGLYYYLRVMITMFSGDRERLIHDAQLNWAQQVGGVMVLGLMLMMLIIGIYPQPFIDLIGQAGLHR
ncbi:MAG TPA: NADH-quinone oxidoreductase subunit NuoN [Solimonas sp.]|nr:NADH-quinone oxidoreductase subunit NuoN [Solimonas sp.]